MMLLAIETTGPLGTVALGSGSECRMLTNHSEYSHLEEIVPMAQQILKEQGVAPEDLDAVAVSKGPGSFTGIRIGVATAKGLAQIWNKPIVAVPTLKTFSFACTEENAVVCPLFDARRSQVYAGAWLPAADEVPCEIVAGAAYGIEEYLELLKRGLNGRKAVFYGDGIKPYGEILSTAGIEYSFADEAVRYQTADNVLKLASVMFKAGDICDCYTAEPDYMRLAEAERKLKEKC